MLGRGCNGMNLERYNLFRKNQVFLFSEDFPDPPPPTIPLGRQTRYLTADCNPYFWSSLPGPDFGFEKR